MEPFVSNSVKNRDANEFGFHPSSHVAEAPLLNFVHLRRKYSQSFIPV